MLRLSSPGVVADGCTGSAELCGTFGVGGGEFNLAPDDAGLGWHLAIG